MIAEVTDRIDVVTFHRAFPRFGVGWPAMLDVYTTAPERARVVQSADVMHPAIDPVSPVKRAQRQLR